MAGTGNAARGTGRKLRAADSGGTRLRPALAGESAALSALCLRSKAHWGYGPDFIRACAAELTLSEADLAANIIQVAKCDDALAGIAEIFVAGREACLEKLFVDPDFMGCGVGRQLLTWAIDEASRRGAAIMTIDADPGAVGFYRHNGARQTGETPSGSIPGRMLPRLVIDLQSD